MFLRQIGQISVDLLDRRFTGSAARRLCSTRYQQEILEEEIFAGTNFASWCLIAKISVSR